MTSRVKVGRYFYGLTIEANNFAFEVKFRLGFEKKLIQIAKWINWS